MGTITFFGNTDMGQIRSNNEDAFIAVGLNSDQYKIITETQDTKYYLRFKILEAFKGR